MKSFRLESALVVVAFGLWCPAPVDAQADAAFRAGLDARDDKRWQVVETEMRRAIQANPQESDRRVGAGLISRGTQYLPYFFLGEALFQQQDCAGAVTAWAISEQQGAVKSRADSVSAIKSGYSTCASRGVLLPADYDPLLASTRLAITEVTALAQRLSSLGQTRREIWRPEMHEQYERARSELQTAQTRLASGTRGRIRLEFDEAKAASDRAATILAKLEATVNAAVDKATQVGQLLAGAEAADRAVDEFKAIMTPDLTASRQRARGLAALARERLVNASKAPSPATINEALRHAQDASLAMSQVLDQARQLARGAFRQRFGEAVSAATEAFSFVDASLVTLDRLAAEQPGVGPANLASERTMIEKQLGAMRTRFESVRKAENLSAVQDVTRMASDARDRLATLLAAFGPLSLRARGVHPALEEGARLFLAGEHQKALSVLDGAVGPGTEAQPLVLHVHLFRAAAAFALYVRSGETDQGLHQQALAAVELCKQISPSFVPDAGTFAPRFISFFQAAGRPPGQPE